jgi:hypothetical protein
MRQPVSDSRLKESRRFSEEEVLYNNYTEFGVPIKSVSLSKMCLNLIYSEVRIGKYFSEGFSIGSGLKQGDALSLLLFNFTLE